MTNTIILHDYETSKRGKQVGELVIVNAEQVGVVLPRNNYTTLVVAGKYVHVTEHGDDVLRSLGWSPQL